MWKVEKIQTYLFRVPNTIQNIEKYKKRLNTIMIDINIEIPEERRGEAGKSLSFNRQMLN